MNRAYLIVILSLLATIVGCGESGNDLIVLQNGSRQIGTLQGCVNASCQLNSQAIPQAAIAWIGFSYAGGTLPAVKNPATDEIHARDGAVESGRLVSISLSKVVTEKSSFDRAQVAWIHLAQRPGLARAPGDASRPSNLPDVYQWEGFITKHLQTHIHNRTGNVDEEWEGKFRVRFLQVPTSKHADGSGSDLYVDNLAPLALDYFIQGQTDRDSIIKISGLARGHLEGETLFKQSQTDIPEVAVDEDPHALGGRFVPLPAGFAGMGSRAGRLEGEILRISRAHPARDGEEGRPNPQDYECGYFGDLPGNYNIAVVLSKSAPGFSGEPNSQLFDGIHITEPGDHSREILVDDIPLYAAHVCGRIFSADQETVSGSRKWRGGDGEGRDTWTFHRIRCNDPKGCKSTLPTLDLAGLPVPR